MSLSDLVRDHPMWYHTLDLGGGVVTPGWFDLRGVVNRLPWPDLRGKRCLDIATYDGFFAFEMERRGAAEVVATDIADHESWDWPTDARDASSGRLPAFTGPPKGRGFEIAAAALKSRVKWVPINIYDLHPSDLGHFDFIFCGSLLVHLREPVRALEAVRSVCSGQFISSESIDLWLSVLHRGDPLARLNGAGQYCEWWTPSAQAHWRMLYSAGFRIDQVSKPFVVPFNMHPRPEPTLWRTLEAGLRWAVTGDRQAGLLHRALLGTPRLKF